MKDSQGVMVATAIAAGITALYFLWRIKRENSKWKEVATVDKLFVHPVKSFRGMSVESFTCCEGGIMINGSDIGDRTFMTVYEFGRFATLRQFPRMVLIKPSIVGQNRLRLEAPGVKPLEVAMPAHGTGKVLNYRVWDSRCPGVDCGEEAASWLQEYLGDPTFRLVFHNKQLPLRELTKLLKFGHLGVYTEKSTMSTFHDFSPFNLVSQSSVDWLNTKLDSEHQVTERNFRPNVLLKGCDAFAEDDWKRIKIGSADFTFAKHCTRCIATTVDPVTGTKDPDSSPLTTLTALRPCEPDERALYGNAPKFSVDFVNIKQGKIHVGDKVYLYIDN